MSEEQVDTSDDNSKQREQEKLVEDLTWQMKALISIDSGQEKTQLESEVDQMLAKISEYVEIVEMIREDTKICVNTSLPLVTEKSRELQSIFDRIDALEGYVHVVSDTLSKLEKQADQAETQFNTFNSLKKKIFGAFSSLGRKQQDTSPQYQKNDESTSAIDGTYNPVNIFSTDDFFSTELKEDSD